MPDCSEEKAAFGWEQWGPAGQRAWGGKWGSPEAGRGWREPSQMETTEEPGGGAQPGRRGRARGAAGVRWGRGCSGLGWEKDPLRDFEGSSAKRKEEAWKETGHVRLPWNADYVSGPVQQCLPCFMEFSWQSSSVRITLTPVYRWRPGARGPFTTNHKRQQVVLAAGSCLTCSCLLPYPAPWVLLNLLHLREQTT